MLHFLSGIDIQKTKIQVFCVTGFLSALSGILLASRLGAASSELGLGYEFDAIAAVIIGGASLYGGSGTVIGATLGAIIISTVRSSVNVLGLQAFWQKIVIGLVVLLAVIVDYYSKNYFGKFIRRMKS
ncbi:MAG: hypothetical protein M1308_02360 [Actinobacteria bacterium]|nr:hypothetical protein [Actinomycetota bacterium]